jgi:hypothetical protein
MKQNATGVVESNSQICNKFKTIYIRLFLKKSYPQFFAMSRSRRQCPNLLSVTFEPGKKLRFCPLVIAFTKSSYFTETLPRLAVCVDNLRQG